MSFVTALALAVALFVAAPYLAHRLRRKNAEDRPFAPARLVPKAPPKARRRSKLEDKALFFVRAAAVVALAALGASPLVTCQRLAVTRSGGASVAIAVVLDDSMSMRARAANASGTRFSLAKKGAVELLSSVREGDAVAIVLAGAPARVALAATTDLGAARATLEMVEESDRATDLDGALAMAATLVRPLPQVDKRIVVLSDLADGQPEGAPLGEGVPLPVGAPLTELRGPASDCALLSAEREGVRVRVTVGCSREATTAGREIVLVAGGKEVVRAPAPSGASGDAFLTLPKDEPAELTARLTGGDAIPGDDEAFVVGVGGPGALAVVSDVADEAAATGGAPVVEQAIAALKIESAIRPVPQLPDRVEDLAAFAGVLLDDPPGLTPEQRHAMMGFLEQGGVVLLALGPRAAAAPLGATFEPLLTKAPRWGETKAAGMSVDSASPELADTAESASDLAAKGRVTLAPEDVNAFETFGAWTDKQPLLLRRNVGRGAAWLVTLPFSVTTSDLPLRPAFVALLDAWVKETRLRAAPRRTDVGATWTFAGTRELAVVGPDGPVAVHRDASGAHVTPPRIGPYRVTADGKKELRVASPLARELDFRPRSTATKAGAEVPFDRQARLDVSWVVALFLLLLFAVEAALRLKAQAENQAAA